MSTLRLTLLVHSHRHGDTYYLMPEAADPVKFLGDQFEEDKDESTETVQFEEGEILQASPEIKGMIAALNQIALWNPLAKTKEINHHSISEIIQLAQKAIEAIRQD